VSGQACTPGSAPCCLLLPQGQLLAAGSSDRGWQPAAGCLLRPVWQALTPSSAWQSPQQEPARSLPLPRPPSPHPPAACADDSDESAHRAVRAPQAAARAAPGQESSSAEQLPAAAVPSDGGRAAAAGDKFMNVFSSNHASSSSPYNNNNYYNNNNNNGFASDIFVSWPRCPDPGSCTGACARAWQACRTGHARHALVMPDVTAVAAVGWGAGWWQRRKRPPVWPRRPAPALHHHLCHK
jgi:hypothetical protein